MNDALYGLYMNRDVALDDCLRASHDPNEFLRMIGQSPEDDQGAKKPGGMAGSATARR
jgi:twitching motility protein PilT